MAINPPNSEDFKNSCPSKIDHANPVLFLVIGVAIIAFAAGYWGLLHTSLQSSSVITDKLLLYVPSGVSAAVGLAVLGFGCARFFNTSKS